MQIPNNNEDHNKKNINLIKNLEEDIEKYTRKLNQHLEQARTEWNFYSDHVDQAIVDWEKIRKKSHIGATDRIDAEVHLSIDAQKTQYFPHFKSQPQASKVYYLEKAKIYHLGIIDEGSNQNFGFLWDERNGPIAADHVITCIHWWIIHNSRGEKKLRLTFDNCRVNKNFMVCRFFFLNDFDF